MEEDFEIVEDELEYDLYATEIVCVEVEFQNVVIYALEGLKNGKILSHKCHTRILVFPNIFPGFLLRLKLTLNGD